MKDDQIINETVDRDADICTKYSYWQKINRLIIVWTLPLILSIPLVAIAGYLYEDGISGFFKGLYSLIKEEWLFFVCLAVGYLSPILANLKLSKFLRFILAGLSALVLCVWMWCLVSCLTDPEMRWMTVVILVLGLISLIPCFFAILISLYSKFAKWRFCRSETALQEKKLKRLQNGIARRIDSFLSRHQTFTLCDSKNFILYSAGWMATVIAVSLILFTLYLFVGGIDRGERSLADMKELSIEFRDIPDEDNAYISLVSLTNKCTVARCVWGDTHNEEERQFIYDFTKLDPSSLTDEDDAKRWNSIQNDTNSLNRARKIISDNEAFFKAFPDAAGKKEFSTRSEISKNHEYNPYCSYLSYYLPFVDYARLFSLRVRLALEDKDIESAMADITTIYTLGEKIATKYSPHEFDSISMEFLVGSIIMRISFEQMQYLIAEGKASDEMLAKFDAIIDKAETSVLNVRNRLIKEWCSSACKAVDWYASKNLFDDEVRLMDMFFPERMDKATLIKELPLEVCFRMILFGGSECTKFLFDREETLNELAELTRTAIAKKRVEITEEERENQSLSAALCKSRNGLGKYLVSLRKGALEYTLNAFVNETLFSISKMKLIIAAAKWRKAHGGENPPSLDALVPEYLPNVPIDPYDKNGGPLKYDAKLGVVWCCGFKGDYDYHDAVKQLGSVDESEESSLRSRINRYSFRIDSHPIF